MTAAALLATLYRSRISLVAAVNATRCEIARIDRAIGRLAPYAGTIPGDLPELLAHADRMAARAQRRAA